MESLGFNPEYYELHHEEHDPTEPTPEAQKISPELTIIVPKDFVLTEKRLTGAIGSIHNHILGDSIEEMRASGLDYSGEAVCPTPIIIMAREIVGTDSKLGWSGMVRDIGEPNEYAKPQTLTQVYSHARRIIDMDQGERNGILHGIDLTMWRRRFMVDSDGRHRILTLKTLAVLGCDVTISGMKVNELIQIANSTPTPQHC